MPKQLEKKFVMRTMDWVKIIVFLLDDVGVIILVFAVLNFLDIEVPIAVTVTLILMAALLLFIIHYAIIPSFHRQPATGREGLVGMEGTAITSLKPSGQIKVDGEIWSAKSVEGNIEAGAPVEVTAVLGLVVEVKPFKD